MVMFPPPGWHGYVGHREEISGLLDPRCYCIGWLDKELLDGRAHALANDDAVIVFAVRTYPEGAKELHGLVAAGRLAAIIPLIGEAERWAKAEGCVFACIASREGWRKVLEECGYMLHQIELRKEL